jgi:hypothetical protein
VRRLPLTVKPYRSFVRSTQQGGIHSVTRMIWIIHCYGYDHVHIQYYETKSNDANDHDIKPWNQSLTGNKSICSLVTGFRSFLMTYVAFVFVILAVVHYYSNKMIVRSFICHKKSFKFGGTKYLSLIPNMQSTTTTDSQLSKLNIFDAIYNNNLAMKLDEWKEPKYRFQQIKQWIFEKGVY